MENQEHKRIGLSDMDASKYMTFGSMYIVATGVTLFPFDTLTVIAMSGKYNRSKQTNSSPNMFKLAHKILRKEGLARFWRGCTTSTLGNFPATATYFFSYETSQEITKAFIPNTTSTNIFLNGFIAGLAAELCGGIFYVPTDTVAQRLQVQNLDGFNHNCRLYRGPLDVVKRMIKSDGIKGLYRGYGASVSSYAPASAVQWGSYELIKPYLYSTFNYLESQNIIPTNMALKDQLLYATSACCASVLAVIANHPFEIIRLRTQLLDSSSKSDSVIIRGGYSHLATTILKQEGWRGFYRALHVRLLLTVPSAVAALSGYDTIKNSSMV